MISPKKLLKYERYPARPCRIWEIIVQLDETTRFDWLISGPCKGVLDRRKAYWTGKSKTFFNKQKQKGWQKFSRKFYFSYWKFYFKWDIETGKISLPTAAFKEDTNMFSTEFREGFGLRLWLYNKALIDQLWGPYGKIFGPQLFVWTSLSSVRTSKLRSEYFPIWTSQLVNKSILFYVIRILWGPDLLY